ncbi:SGNH/GDSL hydrolase family protein [soil metagenome]
MYDHRTRLLAAACASVVALSGLAACSSSDPAPPAATVAPSRAPAGATVVGVIGDSISLGVNACDKRGPCAEAVWAGGTDASVDSIAKRLAGATGRKVTVVSAARDGARIEDALTAARRLAPKKPDLVTMLIGANDACPSSMSGMTSVEDYRARLIKVVAIFKTTSPQTELLMLSIPDIHRLWEIGRTNPRAVALWNMSRSCRVLLGDASSDAPEDVQRRDVVDKRTREFNSVIAKVCAQSDQCVDDDGAVFDYDFNESSISSIDHFHPSKAGQRAIAEAAWQALESAKPALLAAS